jgi:hypothetical protein
LRRALTAALLLASCADVREAELGSEPPLPIEDAGVEAGDPAFYIPQCDPNTLRQKLLEYQDAGGLQVCSVRVFKQGCPGYDIFQFLAECGGALGLWFRGDAG